MNEITSSVAVARLERVHRRFWMIVYSQSVINLNVKLSAAFCDTMFCRGVAAPQIPHSVLTAGGWCKLHDQPNAIFGFMKLFF